MRTERNQLFRYDSLVCWYDYPVSVGETTQGARPQQTQNLEIAESSQFVANVDGYINASAVAALPTTSDGRIVVLTTEEIPGSRPGEKFCSQRPVLEPP
jgi:hypothetical protein